MEQEKQNLIVSSVKESEKDVDYRQVPIDNFKELFDNICRIVDDAKSNLAVTVNSTLTLMYWNIGKTIDSFILGEQRAEYGKQIVSTLSTQLTNNYGKDFTKRNLYRMIQFSQCFPDINIVSTLSAQLPWSHFVEVLPIKDAVAREFYVTMAAKKQCSKAVCFIEHIQLRLHCVRN